MTIKPVSLLLTAFVTWTALALPSAVSAAEISVLCSNGIKAAMEELVPRFEQATGHSVRIRYGLSAVLKREIESGAAFEVAVLTPALIDDLVGQGRIAGDTRATLARSPIGLAVRSGATRPDIRTADALKGTLLAATSISYAKEGASSGPFIELLQRLDLADTLKSKIRPTTTGAEVGAAVARGEAALGVMPVSEILAAPGVEVLGPFPPGLQGYLVMVAGASPGAAKSAAVTELIGFLLAPAALPVLEKRGMERDPTLEAVE